VVQFSGFSVQRITLNANARWHFSADLYFLVMLIEGTLELNDINLEKEQACLMPQNATLELSSSTGAVILLAQPC